MKGFLSIIAYILVIIGALNWGLWGFFQFDFVAWLFKGNTTWASRLIYAIIGLAGLWHLGCFGKCCKAICCREGACCSCGHKHEGGSCSSCGCKEGTCSSCGHKSHSGTCSSCGCQK
ncbi:MAG TPA: DUF378 domain-containing protein [Rhabdochlamydiaceae bacterium]|nr:DUF378 domain-containing protein [Rhabdochlamydiaceae bacterium]